MECEPKRNATCCFQSDMLNTDPRPPQLEQVAAYKPFMSGFASPSRTASFSSPVDVQRQQRRHHARQGFCLELLYASPFKPSCPAALYASRTPAEVPPNKQPRDSELKLLCVDQGKQQQHVQHLIGLCDRMFRTSKEIHPAWLTYDGLPAKRSAFFDLARSCFVSTALLDGEAPDSVFDDVDFELDFAAFAEAICGKQVPEDAYGVPGDIVKLGMEAMRSYSAASRYTHELIAEMRKTSVFARSNGKSGYHSHADAAANLETFLDEMRNLNIDAGRSFHQKLEARYLSLKSGHSSLQLLESKVQAHIAKRMAEGHTFVADMSEDTFARMSMFLDVKAAGALMRTCRAHRDSASLKARLPHLRVRNLPGNFPHCRVISRDRQLLMQNESKPVMRDFVVSRQTVRLFVDFVLPTVRRVPLKKKPRTDGLCNLDHDFSDDEFEDPPEALSQRGPTVSKNHDLSTEWGRKQCYHEQRRRRCWMERQGPDESYDRYTYNCRLGWDAFFKAPLVLAPSLVYADTKQPVPCLRSKSALELSNQMLRANPSGTFFGGGVGGATDLPAVAKFHIHHLSLDHGGRLFCLKIVGTGTLRSGAPFEQTVYTEPFEVVSKMDVAKRAGKRRTTEQLKEDARARAKAKPLPSASDAQGAPL
mgnify:CR=1 FL=1